MNSWEREQELQRLKYGWEGIVRTLEGWETRRRERDRCQQQMEGMARLFGEDRPLVLPLIKLASRERGLLNDRWAEPHEQRALAILRRIYPCEGRSDAEVLEVYAADIAKSLPQQAEMLRTHAQGLRRLAEKR